MTVHMAKANKAALPKLLEANVDSLQHHPAQTTVVIMHAMAKLQSLVKVPERFSDLAKLLLNPVSHTTWGSS